MNLVDQLLRANADKYKIVADMYYYTFNYTTMSILTKYARNTSYEDYAEFRSMFQYKVFTMKNLIQLIEADDVCDKIKALELKLQPPLEDEEVNAFLDKSRIINDGLPKCIIPALALGVMKIEDIKHEEAKAKVIENIKKSRIKAPSKN